MIDIAIAENPTKAELIRRRNKAKHEWLREWLLAYLQQNGPSPHAKIAADLRAQIAADSDIRTGQLLPVSILLKKDGVLYVYPMDPGRDSRRVWSLFPRSEKLKAKPIEKPTRISMGMEPEDLEWMAYWRQRKQRRAAMILAARKGL